MSCRSACEIDFLIKRTQSRGVLHELHEFAFVDASIMVLVNVQCQGYPFQQFHKGKHQLSRTKIKDRTTHTHWGSEGLGEWRVREWVGG